MQVKIKKLVPNAVIPTYSKNGDAGLDIVATSILDDNNFYIEYGTGLAIEIPFGYVGLIFPRSSITNKTLILKNSVGVIDSGYRGEIKFRFQKTYHKKNQEIIGDIFYNIGDKLGQIIILPYPNIELVETDELSSTDRGTGGYGSTGK
jgi:dUTP pyrophosphatase